MRSEPSVKLNQSQPENQAVPGSWWRLLNKYHWYVFILAAFGWLFDCFDQQIFTMSRSITMRDLMPQAATLEQIKYGGWATSIFIIGWATGGLIFGVLGDKWGRAKTMALTIFVYALCTGLSGFAHTWEMFAAFRFLTGAGVGGEFAVGAALVAEVMPDRARPYALGWLQALSTVGNILAAFSLGVVVPSGQLGWGWRGLYFIGALPALVAVFVFWRLKEPERWVKARAAAVSGRSFGSLKDLFGVPKWRRNTFVGLGLAIAGQIGLWGVGFYTPELIDAAIPTLELKTRPKIEAILNANSPAEHSAAMTVLDQKEQRKYLELLGRARGPGAAVAPDQAFSTPLSPEQKQKVRGVLAKVITDDEKTGLKSKGGFLQQLGAFCGMFTFTVLAARWGRRRTFFLALILAWASLVVTFWSFHEPRQIWYLWPMLGFATLAPFGLYAIYFPELFPTRLRTTGTSFCYNVGRYVTAFGLIILGPLAEALQGATSMPGFRMAAMVLSCSYLVGLVALIWAPETVDQPLPEEQRAVLH